jgi:5-methylcytosine-specific restriction enzyme subunit McrC
MLCYAHEMPSLVPAFRDADDALPQVNFIAELFLLESGRIIKNGISKYYQTAVEETGQLNGKVLFEPSLNLLFQRKPTLFCEKDDYEADHLLNQLMKSTLIDLAQIESLPKELKGTIVQQLAQLRAISKITVERRHFFDIRLTPNTIYYQKMLLLARFLFEWRNLFDDSGIFHLFAVPDDEMKMRKVFEKFILHFYRYEQTRYWSKPEKLQWGLVGGNPSFIPEMRTDITLVDKVTKQKIIIDAKYYAQVFDRTQYGQDKIRSGHLYQLFAYLQHSLDDAPVHGILLYPTNGAAVDETYTFSLLPKMGGSSTNIRIYSLDLNQPWVHIHHQLLTLVGA